MADTKKYWIARRTNITSEVCVSACVYLCVLVACRLSTNKLIKRFISHIRSALYIDRHERRRVASRETESAQQATEADWLTRERDSRCAEPSKTRPPSYVPVTCVGGWRKKRDRLSVLQVIEAGSRGNVIVDAQSRPKLVRFRTCRSLVPAGVAQRERQRTARERS
jgi:hypothetical protein